MLWSPKGAGVEDIQNVMDPPTAEEPLGSRAESRCRRAGGTAGRGKMRVRACLQRAVHALRLHRTRRERESSGTQKENGGRAEG